MRADVVIVGAGIVGCATAYYLARQGADVVVVDRAGIAAGASGRNNGLIEHPYDVASTDLFNETVGILTDVLGDAFPREPAQTLLLAEDQAGAQQLVRHYSQFATLAPRLLDPDQARATEPLLADDLWSCMLQTGHPISPLQATSAFAQLARAEGARFMLGQPVEIVRSGSQVIGAHTAAVQHLASAVLISAGAGSTELLGDLARPDLVTPLWGVIVSVELPNRPAHPLIEGAQAVQSGGGELAVQAPFTLLDCPGRLAVGSTMLEGPEPDAASWTSRLLDRGARFVPAIAQARVHETLVCARPRSFDTRPILGRLPGQDRLWVATGHGGRGMSTGPASARLVAESILTGNDDAIPLTLSARRLADAR